MQIDTSPCRQISEGKSSVSKKSGKENFQSASSHPRKSRRAKARSTYHRLDHTYAAASSINGTIQQNTIENKSSNTIIVIEDEDGMNSKNSWLRNLCLEYQPRKDNLKMKVPSEKEQKETLRGSPDVNGTLKQYRKNNRKKTDLSRLNVEANDCIPEDQKRWTAALALLELQHS